MMGGGGGGGRLGGWCERLSARSMETFYMHA